MWKLFGGKKKAEPEKPKVEAIDAVQKLDERVCDIEKRTKVIEVRANNHKAEALKKKKAGDQRGALMALKKKKMLDKEVNKLDGMRILLD